MKHLLLEGRLTQHDGNDGKVVLAHSDLDLDPDPVGEHNFGIPDPDPDVDFTTFYPTMYCPWGGKYRQV